MWAMIDTIYYRSLDRLRAVVTQPAKTKFSQEQPQLGTQRSAHSLSARTA
jgi:hypothetical protein